jgi:hypothetical protein
MAHTSGMLRASTGQPASYTKGTALMATLWTAPRGNATCIRINESHDDEECSQHNIIHTCSLSTQALMKALHDLAHAKHISQPACADAELFSDALFTFGYLQLPSVSLRDWQFLQWLWSCLAQLLSQYS